MFNKTIAIAATAALFGTVAIAQTLPETQSAQERQATQDAQMAQTNPGQSTVVTPTAGQINAQQANQRDMDARATAQRNEQMAARQDQNTQRNWRAGERG